MKSYCTKGILLLAVALLLLGTAACTQNKPAVPTPTLQVFNNTPVLAANATETPGAPGTAPAAVGTQPAGGTPAEGATPAPGGATTPIVPGTEPAGPQQPTALPTPTSSFPVQPTQAAPGAPTQPAAPSSPSAPTTAGNCPNPYTVQRGDWLYQIARNCGVSPRDLIAANPGVNPNYLIPGQTLTIPGSSTAPSTSGQPSTPSGRTYVVRRGDTMFSIAVRNGTTVLALMQANGISNPNFIFVGQVLVIP